MAPLAVVDVALVMDKRLHQDFVNDDSWLQELCSTQSDADTLEFIPSQEEIVFVKDPCFYYI